MDAVTAFPDRAALMAAAADRMAEALRAGLQTRGAACAALSGGETPEPAYRLLADKPLDWPNVTFALVDERFVPADHAASNEGLLRRMLAPALASGARLVPMFTPGQAPEEAAAAAEARYAALQIDVALMGMGADGHTASWFPGAQGLASALDPAANRTVIALHAPQPAGDRLSLTLAALTRARRVLLLITGVEKRERLAAAMISPPEEAPVAALFSRLPAPPEVLWAL